MDESLVKEIIRDLEKVSKIINYRLDQLYEMIGDSSIGERNIISGNNNNGNSIKKEMDRQRAEMMSEMDKIRRQAMAQVQSTISRQDINIPNVGQPTIPSHMLRRGEKNNDEK